ncbi:MAG: DUF4468 domain-containing protein [Bacteroidia bacterium]
MKLALTTIFVAVFAVVSIAQEQKPAPQMPVSEITKLITYTSVVNIDGMSKTELYNRALKWYHTFYTNPTDVIRENSAEAAKIAGKARFKVFTSEDKKGAKVDMGPVPYTITFEGRDGRYKVELSEFNWKQVSYYPIEKWMDKQDAAYKPNYDHYLLQTDEYAKQTLADLEKFMKTEPVKDNRDKW